ncbi:hypothetical protein [Kineosporia sp. R_H_3]|uniref:hypothetical protein n=1 Tax=Kineosporia sp. R_H_3 TaxID=1961848 RepID=UPI000B4A84CC|nr:hypothetical protein [Kineosporia sp. R_H_3]
MDELTMVREALADVADRVSSRPPDRAQIDRGLRRVRRRRRVARAGKGLGALGGVAAVLGAVQLGVVPVPSWAPVVPITSPAASALANGPTRGSLAGDAAWLQALREKVATFDQAESGGERWRAPSADRVDVIYAGDLGDFRVAVVETPLRWGAIEARQQLWYLGPRGSAAAAMEQGRSEGPTDLVSETFGPGSVPAGPTTRGAALVLGPARDVEQVGPVRIAADGTVSWPAVPVRATEPGVWELVLPAGSGRVFLRAAGLDVVAVGDRGWGGETDAERAALVRGATPAVRTGSVPARVVSSVPGAERLAGALAAAQYASALDVATSGRRLLWSGTVDGTTVDVVEVTAPSGGRVLVAVQDVFAPVMAGGGSGQPVAVGTSGADDGPALAWVFQEPEVLADGGYTTSGAQHVVLVGPQQAVAARVTTADGTEHPVDLPGGGPGVLTVEGARSVRFVDAEGRTVAETTVVQPDAAGSGLQPPQAP